MLQRLASACRRSTLGPAALVFSMLTIGIGLSGCNGEFVTSDLPGSAGGNGMGSGNGGNGNGPSIGNSGTGNNNDPSTPPDPSAAAAPMTSTAAATCTGDENPGPRRLRLLTRDEYARTVVDLLGVEKPETDNLPVETVVDGFNNNAKAAAVTSRHVDEYLASAETLAGQALSQNRARLLCCQSGDACAHDFIASFGRRAFRRPLTDEEIARYQRLFDAQLTGGTFDTGVGLVVRAMLSSPNFLYRSEMGEAAGDGSFKLTGYEVASALSYFLWGSMPDDALLDAAKNGALATQGGVDTQAKRLIADPRSHVALASFFRQWLDTDGLLYTNKDSAIFPTFSDTIRTAMLDEQDGFIGNVMFAGTGKFAELFNAGYVFVNQPLARFYGLPNAESVGPVMQKTMLPATGANRSGLLTLGAVLGMHAHSDETSPVKRGLFVRSRLLCQSLPPPPPNVDTTPPGLDPTLTTRARFDRHSSDPACKTCHKLLDPVGYGFERYDGVGAYRTQEAGMDIDESGELLGLEDLMSDAKTSFTGPIELGKIIAASPNAQACLARQLFRFVRGGENGAADACAIAKVQAAFKTSGFDLQQLLLDVIHGKSFASRS